MKIPGSRAATSLRFSPWLAAASILALPLGPPASAHPPAISAPAPVPLGKAAFEGLLKQLQRLSFSDEQLTLAREAARGGAFFTSDQVGQLMRTSAFGDNQVRLAAALYPHVVDPQNFAQLASILTFESDRQKLRQLAGR